MREITIDELRLIWFYFDANQIAELQAYDIDEQNEILNEINELIKL